MIARIIKKHPNDLERCNILSEFTEKFIDGTNLEKIFEAIECNVIKFRRIIVRWFLGIVFVFISWIISVVHLFFFIWFLWILVFHFLRFLTF